jgi:mycothiol system anti-sigma-R factor
MISCSEVVRQLWEYLDGTVDEADRVPVEEHLSRCRRCCGELEFARELRRVLAKSADVDLPPHVLRRLNETLEELDWLHLHRIYSHEVLVPQSAIDRALGVANRLPHATVRCSRQAAAQHPRLRSTPLFSDEVIALLRRLIPIARHGRVAVAVVVRSLLPTMP